MEQWAMRDPPKKYLLGKRASPEDGNHVWMPFSSRLETFTRPISALARHRVHQLSDIREASGSSKTGNTTKATSGWTDGGDNRPKTPPPTADALSHSTSSEYPTPNEIRPRPRDVTAALGNKTTSAISLPHGRIPERRSSASIFSRSLAGSAPGSLQELHAWKVPELDDTNRIVPDRGRANSPVRRAMASSAQSSEVFRPSHARTFIRTTPPHDILDNGSVRHSRVQLSIRLPSPLFVGGGTVEGQMTIEVDGGGPKRPKTQPIYISKASVDVIGVEEISDGRRWVFLSLATELFDNDNPPPPALVKSQLPQSSPDLWWEMKTAMASVPFCVNLPLKLGPPPYASKQASIRYLLCPSLQIKVGDKRSIVRQTWNIQMLTVHDPERALASLPSPLLAADTFYLAREPEIQTVKLTAGLHRQTWVNGAKIFIDVHIANNTPKTVKKIEVQLEKTILWYTHAAAGTVEKSANHLRLPKRTDAGIISGTTVKKSDTWQGVSPHSSEVRTIELEAPRGHVTISTGRYFEVRYFVNVVATVKMFKTVAVQLPVTIIPINSLDILPNSLAQVAASIEAKRAKTVPVPPSGASNPSYHQGQVFTVPLRRSLEIAREEGKMPLADLDNLKQDLDKSPRKIHGRNHSMGAVRNEMTNENHAPERVSMASSSHHHFERHPSCYHCHLAENQDTPMAKGPRLPRLQVSTSGLGFSETEFEVPADSPPRKVMLSERERNMINQERELRKRQNWNDKQPKRPSVDMKRGNEARRSRDQPSYNNVVADPNAGPRLLDMGNFSPGGVRWRNNAGHSQVPPKAARSRSKTNPENLARAMSIHKPRRKSSSARLPVDGPAYAGVHRRLRTEVGYKGSLDQLF
ncbi:hypothetical protein LTS07_005523 [Exophiala sideris]|uniref:Arrestin C-terminal-like domain-containing protein n=1 Tax=Exophiala sideris TaxID=1016849 RepID=A0ABR0J835_9EURO|nr:hypothetical protein LTR13_010366 [Exophiala sideris]KAK5029799.1 hypothetical protein LTS07_005523 [Exophiala sideris]KAK5058439.1 hypothetical protein LTR69_006844 [Exophiala sideris]KAK5178588.1 hypothetical protein LTR44_008959 [Eurotiomycetes sp. CCFEE 6388]